MRFIKKILGIKDKEETLMALNMAIQQAENKLIILNSKLKKSDNLVCGICFNNQINTTLIPCGHCYCDKCIKESNECFYCRKTITKKHKIFLN